MPIVVDKSGRRVVADAELEALRVESGARFAAFWDVLEWQPIADYDRERAVPVIVRDDLDNWEFAAWETRRPFPNEQAEPDDDTPMWRDCQESREGRPIGFEPTNFAIVTEDWVVALTAD